MYRKKAVVAMMMCAAMALIAAAPLAMSEDTGTIHTIVKYENGPPSTCAVTWELAPTVDGTWYGHIVNGGMRWLIIDVLDTDTNNLLIDREMYRFALGNVVDTEVVDMTAGHIYSIKATPNGAMDTTCTVEDMFEPIVALEPPVAEMSMTVDYLEVTVDGSASYDNDGTIVSYEWDFGDSATAAGMTATHVYAADGTYTITLTVTDDDAQTGTASEPVTVAHELIPPVASFTVDVDGLEVSVHATSSYDPDGTIVSYDWDFGDGATDSGITATHVYAADGTYTIMLIVTDDDALTGTTSEPVTVEKVLIPPVASFTVGVGGLEVAVDGSASYDNDGTIVSYEWDFGDSATASGITATHAYAADGTYTITLTVTDNDGLTATTSEPVTVEKVLVPPVADFTITVDGLTVSVDASDSYDPDGPIVSFDWDFGDGSVGVGETASHTYEPPLDGDWESTASSPALGIEMPHPIMGIITNSVGDPVPDCVVTVTDVTCGESAVVVTGSDGRYSYDIANLPGEYAVGDEILVEAVKGTLSGSATIYVSSGFYDIVDITLEGETPPEPFDVTITLTVTDEDGLTSTISKTVTLYP